VLRVGLTGGIASGKSLVLRGLAAAGLHTLDLDAVAHLVTAPGGAAHREVVEAFGPGILLPDGSIDRRALGSIVFEDPGARSTLNAIVHPRVREEEARRVAAVSSRAGTAFVTDAALLVEAGLHLRFDRLVVVYCPADLQLARLMRREGLDEAAARARLASQMPPEEKRRYGHSVIDSSGPVEETERAAARLAEELLELAAAPAPRVPVARERALAALLHAPSPGPRGLDAAAVLADAVEAGGIEMERLARRLVPPAAAPWYRAAAAAAAGGSPEALAPAVVLWVLARRGMDAPLLASAAATLARLTHVDDGSVAGACLFARALMEVVVTGSLPDDLPNALADWSALAERWGGARPREGVRGAIEAAQERRGPAAAAAGAGSGGEPGLAAAILRTAAGTDESAAGGSLATLVTRAASFGPRSGEP
jgi:dephospho-CoA kinase